MSADHGTTQDAEMFSGKVGVITGGASGIGLALAKKFGAAGLKLVIADIQQDALDAAVEALTADGVTVVGIQGDVSDRSHIQDIADLAMSTYGALHFAFNNAGVGSGGVSWEMSEADWKWVIDVDLWSVIHGVGIFTPLIIASGGGHIVNTASMAGLTSAPFMGPYNAAKHAVVAISETMFLELEMNAPNVGVSVLCPGWVQTRIHESARNRPTDGEQAVAADTDPAMAAIVQDTVGNLIADGITPDSVADLVIDAVENKKFYILTHPDWNGMVANNTKRMLNGENPAMAIPGVGEI